MNEDLESRIFDAVNEAKDMFWEHIASEFTEAKFGDMSWEDISEFDAAAERAVRAWVANNVPKK